MASIYTEPFGSHAPGWLDRQVIAVTRKLPVSWAGFRLSILLRRIVTSRIGGGAIDSAIAGVRLRLYPHGNGCEKTILFTPHMYDAVELAAIDAEIARRQASGGTFTFVDIGANVGLYSLFAASRAGRGARVMAVEPQADILDRLRFNLALNPQLDIQVAPVALADREGEVTLRIHRRDRGCSNTREDARPDRKTLEVVRVPCRALAAVLAGTKFDHIDALKIDVEGVEDVILIPFLNVAPRTLLPRLILIEDWRKWWRTDLFATFERLGYVKAPGTRRNAIFRLPEAQPSAAIVAQEDAA
jgi:FkbM family methyltransferase